MLRDDELPPLPAPDFRLRWVDGSEYKVTKPNIGNTDVFTAEQMREYASAVEQAAYAAAIKACDKIAGNHRQFSDERRKGAGMCSAEISALKEQK